MMRTTMIIVPAAKKLEAYLESTGMEYEKYDNGKMNIYTSDYIAPDYKEVDPLIVELLKHIGEDCSIEGCYDADESSGCTMMFRFDWKAGTLKKHYSDWITFLNADDYEDYEDFCDCYEDRFTEEEYEAFCQAEYYLLDGGDGDAVQEDQIPMTEYPLCV